MNLPNILTIRLHPADNVVVARADIVEGVALGEENIATAMYVPAGHKVATAKIEQGSPVRKYNQIIGFAAHDILPGEHVHTQNLDYGDFERDYDFGADVKEGDFAPEEVVAEVVAMVGGEDNDGVFPVAGLFQCLEDEGELGVEEGDTGVVGLHVFAAQRAVFDAEFEAEGFVAL